MRLQNKAAHLRAISEKFAVLRPCLNERQRRLWAATEARALGHGGIRCVAEATKLSQTTVQSGISDLQRRRNINSARSSRVRQSGAGRKLLTKHDPKLVSALDALIEPSVRGDPRCPLRWTCKSKRQLAEELTRQGHPVSYATVARLLKSQGYSLQGNRKTREGRQHPDRNSQFEHISKQVFSAHRRNQPAISVDTKKKENIGRFKNGGREWNPKGRPETVDVHDFPNRELGKVIPYGVYDIGENNGWVSVGIDHDTAEFAVRSIESWWHKMGMQVYPDAEELTITADAGGSNGYRNRLWKMALQRLADSTGLLVRVCHFPPGTSKWNKIEHRMFCHITRNWRARPLLSQQTVVQLIGHTTTNAGLRVRSELDTRSYPLGVKISDEDFATLLLTPDRFHGDWNYVITPRK
jgi:hypothetical protein